MDTHGGNPYKSLKLKQVSIVQINVDFIREWFLVHIFLYPIMFLLHLCPGLHTITNFTVLCRFATKNRGRNDFSHFTIFRYFFVFSTYQRALPNSTNSAAKLRKSGPQRLILLYYFSLLFSLSHLPDGASEFNKFCENGKKSGPQRFFLPVLFFSLTRRRFRIQQILWKYWKVVVATIFRTLLFSLTRESFRIKLISRKVPKIVPFPHFTIFPCTFIT